MAEPFKEGKGWAFRLRLCGQDLYRAGFDTEAKARKAMADLRCELENLDKAAGLGPHRTSLAVAFSDYGRQRLPYLKGAEKDANRINRYLRAVGLPVIRLEPQERPGSATNCYWRVSLVREPARAIPRSLGAHRARQSRKTAESDKMRAQLAAMMMAEVSQHHLQQLVDAMRDDGYAAATIEHERAELRRLFAHARKIWRWSRPKENPTSGLTLPSIDNARNRVLTNAEWRQMAKTLANYGNHYVLPLVCLMLETAMRSCEPLTYARWGDVNWTRRVLELPDAKGGKRDVPLNPGAIAVLENLAERDAARTPQSKIFPTTYEAVKKAWAVARAACGIKNVGLHDLRHTAATRYAHEFKGNLPVIMLITGHKTVSMAMRYINLKADDVVSMMHQDTPIVDHLPAGYQASLLCGAELPEDALDGAGVGDRPSNVVRVSFGRRAA